jgi:cytoskeletal protein CcmA (bactofilin family)
MRRWLLGCLLFALACTAWADDKEDGRERHNGMGTEQRVEHDFGDDHFAAGRTVTVVQPVAGDLIIGGGKITVQSEIGGDAAIAGGNVRMDGRVGESLFLGGGQVVVNGKVARNARVAGGQIEFGPASEVAGNLSVGGGDVTLKGRVNGYLQAAGGKVLIDGVVGGDVEARAGELVLGPNARIAGHLRYASREAIQRDPGAQVQGKVERIEAEGGWPVPEDVERGMGRTGGWIWSLGLLLLVAVLVWAMPRFFGQVADTWRARFPLSLLLGFVLLVCVPVAAVLFLVTIIGVPLGLLTMALYPVLLLLGYVCTGIALGQWGAARLSPAWGRGSVGHVTAAVLGVLVLGLLARVPWLGGVVMFVALLAGLGALGLQAWKSSRGSPVA